MSCIIESNRTCTLLDCTDSGLSISGNVISVLTFFVAAVATYYAFFSDVRDIPQSADDYSNDIRSLHDQLWTIGDIHGQLAKLVAENGLRISDINLQSRLQSGESMKEARKFLDDYSATYQNVFTNYFKRRRWLVRVKWLLLQRRVAHFRTKASELRNIMSLDLLAITLNMNIALQKSLQKRDAQADKLTRQIDNLTRLISGNKFYPSQDFANDLERDDSPTQSIAPSVMMDPTTPNPPRFLFSGPENDDSATPDPPTFMFSPPGDEEVETTMRPLARESFQSPSRSASPFSTRKPLDRSLSVD